MSAAVPQFSVQKATREQLRARVMLSGMSGAGKTMTALEIAFTLASAPERIVVIDTEYRSARKYVGEPRIDVITQRELAGATFDGFLTIDLEPDAVPLTVQTYILAMKAALDAGAEVIVIDSVSHAWDSILQAVDDWKKRNPRKDQRGAWNEVGNPMAERLTKAIVRCPAHLVVTARAKSEWAVDEKGKPAKIGLAPKVRDGFEYEFDLAARMEPRPVTLHVEKTRMGSVGITPEYVEAAPGREFAERIAAWIGEGERPAEQVAADGPVAAPEDSPSPAGDVASGDTPPPGDDPDGREPHQPEGVVDEPLGEGSGPDTPKDEDETLMRVRVAGERFAEVVDLAKQLGVGEAQTKITLNQLGIVSSANLVTRDPLDRTRVEQALAALRESARVANGEEAA